MALTGRGHAPHRSAWLQRGQGRGRGYLLYRTFAVADAANTQPTVWRDWWFDPAAGGATLVAVSAAVLTASGQAIKLSASRIVAAVPLVQQGQPLILNARRLLAFGPATLMLVAQSLAVNARTLVAAGQAALALAGQSLSLVNLASGARQLWSRIRISV